MMDEESRLLAAINELRLAERGTLWIIKDTAWEKAISGFKRKRKGHPGLSISTKTYKSLVDTVPMMIGSSRYSGGSFVVQDVMSSAHSKEKLTFFNVIRPRPLEASENQPFAIDDFRGYSEEVTRNEDKPRLNDEEMADLNSYLNGKGVKA